MISSGIIITLLIFQFIKIMIDLVIRGCALYTLYGWSMKLLAAFFSSVTHLLVALSKDNTTQNIRKSAREEFELKEVIVQRPTISNPIIKNSTIQRRVEFELPPPTTSKFQKLRLLTPFPSSAPRNDAQSLPLPPRPCPAPINYAQPQNKNLSTKVFIFAID